MAERELPRLVNPQQPITPDPQLSANLKKLRRAAGLSQAELAKRMRELGRTNWHQNTVSRIELGKQEVIVLADIRALGEILDKGILRDTHLGRMLTDLGTKGLVLKLQAEVERAEQLHSELGDTISNIQEIAWSLKDSHGFN